MFLILCSSKERDLLCFFVVSRTYTLRTDKRVLSRRRLPLSRGIRLSTHTSSNLSVIVCSLWYVWCLRVSSSIDPVSYADLFMTPVLNFIKKSMSPTSPLHSYKLPMFFYINLSYLIWMNKSPGSFSKRPCLRR